MSKRSSSGQSLIEVVVSLGVAVVLAVSLIATSLVTQKTARVAKNNNQATKLAQESIEKIRVFRDRKGFGALTANSCLILGSSNPDPTQWGLSTAGCVDGESISASNTNFTRKIEIMDSSPTSKLVTVIVSWDEPGGTQTVKNQTFLSQWPSPL